MATGVAFIKSPCEFSFGEDVDLFLARFDAFAEATECDAKNRFDLFKSFLDDRRGDSPARQVPQDQSYNAGPRPQEGENRTCYRCHRVGHIQRFCDQAGRVRTQHVPYQHRS